MDSDQRQSVRNYIKSQEGQIPDPQTLQLKSNRKYNLTVRCRQQKEGNRKMERKKPEAGEKYRHFKGGIYEILHCAISTETREEMVVYVAVNRTKGKVFVSRLVNFMSPLIREQADEWGQKYRFEKIEEVAPICESEALQDDMTMILEFLDLEKNEEKLEYLKKHRLVLSERFLTAAAESLEYAEREESLEERYAGLVRFLQMKSRYESGRLR